MYPEEHLNWLLQVIFYTFSETYNLQGVRTLGISIRYGICYVRYIQGDFAVGGPPPLKESGMYC